MIKNLCNIGHILFIIFMILTPFISNDPSLLVLHFQLVIFLVIKWITYPYWPCGFLLVEQKIRNIPKKDCLMNHILSPITEIFDYPYHEAIIIITIILGICAYTKYLLITI